MSDPKPAKTPCPSCPYRCDVPSGIWDASEYEKLKRYDGEILDQLISGATGLFFCHQQNGKLCAGWVGCHIESGLLAIGINAVDPSTYDYRSPVPLFASGAEAAAHGMADIADPSIKARYAVEKLEKMQARKRTKS